MQLLSSFSCNMYVFLLWLPCVADAYIIFLSCFFFFSIFHCLISVSQIGYLPYFYTWCGCSANLECMSEMCCKRLAGNAGPKKPHKIHHLGTIAQLCRTISSQLRHISTIGKKLVKQQYLPHMSLQYGELWPTSGCDRFISLGHPSKFQRVSRLGINPARHSSNGHQPYFAALNRGCHLYSAGRPSRWALAHISSSFFSSPNLSGRRLDVYHTLAHSVALVRI